MACKKYQEGTQVAAKENYKGVYKNGELKKSKSVVKKTNSTAKAKSNVNGKSIPEKGRFVTKVQTPTSTDSSSKRKIVKKTNYK